MKLFKKSVITGAFFILIFSGAGMMVENHSNHQIFASSVAISSDKDTVYISITDDPKKIIETAGPDQTLILSAGTFLLDKPIALSNKHDLHITGTLTADGQHATTLKWTAYGVGFYLFSNLKNVTIENLKIIGPWNGSAENQPTDKFEAVSCTESIDEIDDLTIHNLIIENVALGIYMGPAPAHRNNSFSNLKITDNYINNTYGTAPTGWGYGIRCAFIDSAVIENNFISNATRHSIYVACGLAGDSYIIKNNFILNHAKKSANHPDISPYNIAALVAARSNHIRLENNVVMNCYSNVALSVEYDDYYNLPVDDVILINNRIIGARKNGIWVNTGKSHMSFGNEVILNPRSKGQALLLENNSRLAKPRKRWVNTTIKPNGDGFFVIDAKSLSWLDLSAGELQSASKTNWTGLTAMTSFKDAEGRGNRLYFIKKDTLVQVNPVDWKAKKSKINWSGTQFITATRNHIYIIQNNILHRVSPETMSYFYNETDWSGTQAICGWRDRLYIMRAGEIYIVEPENLNARRME